MRLRMVRRSNQAPGRKSEVVRTRLAAAAFLLSAVSPVSQAQQIAFTIDDLPAHGPLPAGTTRSQIAEQVVEALAHAGLPPTYGFINGVRVEESPADVSVLDIWRKSGNLLGNHTWSHMNLNQHTPQEFEQDVEKNEPLLTDKMSGTDWHWLRYPFLAEGDTPEKRAVVRSYLAAHKYRIASVTMSFGDYLWNEPYARCLAKRDTAAVGTLESSYLQAAKYEAQYELQRSQVLFSRDIPFVLLMHIGAFDAHMLPRLLAAYKSMGFRFISLETAERDPFYEGDTTRIGQAGIRDPKAVAVTRKLPVPPASPASALDSLCR